MVKELTKTLKCIKKPYDEIKRQANRIRKGLFSKLDIASDEPSTKNSGKNY